MYPEFIKPVIKTDLTVYCCSSVHGLCTPPVGMLIRRVVNISLGILIGYLSTPVVLNLLSSRQVMNTSFDPLRIVNTYGAFGRYRIHQDRDGPFKHFQFFFCKHFQNLSSMLVYSLRIKVTCLKLSAEEINLLHLSFCQASLRSVPK